MLSKSKTEQYFSPDQGLRRRALVLAISGILGAGLAHGQVAENETPERAENETPERAEEASDLPLELEQIDVSFRGDRMSSPRYQRDLLDTPRIISVLPEDLLREQNVTSLRDAMRNIPGISLQAGEGNPPGGDQLKIRGFNARDDINVDGVRDLGNYFRDPFYVEQIEVVKGPNSAFSGRGSAGGTINFVTKQPQLREFNRLEASVGTDDYVRTTVDINQPLDDNSAFRLNVMGHAADVPGRDVVNDKRYGLFGAYTWGLAGNTQISANWLHTRQDNIEDKGLPFDREGVGPENVSGCFDPDDNRFGRTGSQRCGDGFYTGELPPGISYSDYFGHVDDFQRIDVDILGLTFNHTFSPSAYLRNSLRYSEVKNDSITSSPRIKVPDEDDWGSRDFSRAQVQGDLKPRDQVDEGWFNQTDLVLNFATGRVFHDLVLGTELNDIDYENRRRPDVKGPRTDLLDPERRERPAAPFDGTIHRFETEGLAFYALDTLQFSPQWELNLGVRWDRVEARASDEGWEARGEAPIDVSRTDQEWSYSAGLVYKPATTCRCMRPTARPSKSPGRSIAIRCSWPVVAAAGLPRLSCSTWRPRKPKPMNWASNGGSSMAWTSTQRCFRTDKTKARLPGLGQDDPSVLDTEQRVDGIELLAAGMITPECVCSAATPTWIPKCVARRPSPT